MNKMMNLQDIFLNQARKEKIDHWNSAGNTVFGTADLSGHFIGNWRYGRLSPWIFGFLIFTVAGSRLLDVASTEKTDTRPHSPHKEKTGSAGSQSVHFFTGMYPHDEYFLLGKIPAGI